MKLQLENISKSFGEKQVLRDVCITAEGGKAFGLLGRNGAGKTTAIRILMGVFPADSGRVLTDGEPIDYKKVGLGYLPEERGMYPKKKIIDQLVYFARLKGMEKTDAIRAVDLWLRRLGMTEYREKKLETLSKGNQQKIQLITALAHDPHIIVLDEPFSGLDPVNAMVLKDVVKEQVKKGKIVLFSSHQMSYIEEFCDNIAILGNGRVLLSGDLRDIKLGYAGDRLTVKLSEPDALLRDFGNAASLSGENTVTLRLREAGEKASAMKQITERYDIYSVGVFEPTLNDIFVEYAGQETGGKEK